MHPILLAYYATLWYYINVLSVCELTSNNTELTAKLSCSLMQSLLLDMYTVRSLQQYISMYVCWEITYLCNILFFLLCRYFICSSMHLVLPKLL